MHAVFMLYGKKESVDVMIRDMAAQKLQIKFYKQGEPDQVFLMDCQVRTLPFGVYEFVFPKEFADAVLTTLRFHQVPPYNLAEPLKFLAFKINPLKLIKKFLHLEDPPEFKKDNMFPWIMNDVSIIPLGVRYDKEITNPDRPGVAFVGWSHEGI